MARGEVYRPDAMPTPRSSKKKTKAAPAKKKAAPAKKKAAPKKAAAKKKAAPKRPAGKKPAKGGPRELDILAVPTPDGMVLLGVVCAFSYKEERIRDFVQAIEEVDRFNAEHGTDVEIVRDEVLTHAMRIGLVDGLCRMRFSPMIVRGILGHEAPDTPLGDAVVWRREGAEDVVLPTGRYRGERNVALWLPDPRGADIRRESGRIVFDVADDRLIAVQEFRAATGLYRMEPHTRLPVGELLPDDSPPTLTIGTGQTFAYRFGEDGRVELGPPPVLPDTLRYFQANETGPCVSALVHGSIGNDPPIGVANGIPWSVTAFVEMTPMEVVQFRPRSLNDYEFSMDDLLGA